VETKCLNCGAVLTNELGERLLSGVAAGSLPARPHEMSITWLRCDRCYAAANPKTIVATPEQWRAATRSTIDDQPESLDTFGTADQIQEITAHTLGWFGSTLRRLTEQ
jgi:hypothetical protein